MCFRSFHLLFSFKELMRMHLSSTTNLGCHGFPTKWHLNAAQQPSVVSFTTEDSIMKLVLQTVFHSKGGRWVGAFSVPLPRSRGVYSATLGVNAFLHSRQFPYTWAAVSTQTNNFFFSQIALFLKSLLFCCHKNARIEPD